MTLVARCLLSMALTLPALAQVTARQGSTADLRKSEFASPMVLELPLDKLRTEGTTAFFAYTDQGSFVCDDVTLPLISVRRAFTQRGTQVELKLESTAYVRPSYDRKVVLQFTISHEGRTLASSEQQISAKEKKYRSDSSTLTLPKADWDRLFEGDAKGILKVVMTVESDR